jgi:hypothetical protein
MNGRIECYTMCLLYVSNDLILVLITAFHLIHVSSTIPSMFAYANSGVVQLYLSVTLAVSVAC